MESILNSTKKILGIGEDYTAFDTDLIIHINSAFSILAQLGVGPVGGFSITSADETWADFTEDDEYNSIKTYIYLRVRQWFDPPTTSYLIGAYERQIQELEWRISTHREETGWVDPDPEPVEEVA